GREKIAYLHPRLEPILKKTYGIAVYQEQLMEIARELAGFTFSEADTLRKAVGKKIKSLLNEQSQKLIDGMMRNGIPAAQAQEIWRWFEPFARYGFNRSHAACYALIGYRTAYLKAHYPEEFTASLLNAELQDTDRIALLVNEAKQAGIEVLPPDVNKSSVNFAPEGGKIRFGLLAIKNVGAQVTESIIAERSARGPFVHFSDFLSRIQHKDLNKKSLESMIKAGVFDSFGIERNQALQNIDEILKFTSAVRRNGEQAHVHSLFGADAYAGPKLTLKPAPPADHHNKLLWEKELLGLYVSDHPLNRFTERIGKLGTKPIKEARLPKNDNLTFKIAGLVSQIKKILTKSGQQMIFVKVEDFSPQPLEVVVFNSTLMKTAPVWQENNIVVIEGRMSWRNGEPKMICEQAAVLIV
ncbi:MAG: OB-fold nucleic acid binding domain-containing protein, partial [Patescibacteria group bacterium]